MFLVVVVVVAVGCLVWNLPLHSLLPLHLNHTVSLHIGYTLRCVKSCQLLLEGINTDKVRLQQCWKTATNAGLKTVISCEIQQDSPGDDQNNSKTLRLVAKIFCNIYSSSISFLEIQSPTSLFSLPYEKPLSVCYLPPSVHTLLLWQRPIIWTLNYCMTMLSNILLILKHFTDTVIPVFCSPPAVL